MKTIMDKAKFERLRSTEFSRIGDKIYLDGAGSSIYANSHIQRYFQELERNLLGNPHSGNACSQRMADIAYQARLAVLQRFNVTADDYHVIFTSGATAALKIVGECFDWTPESMFAYTEDNHTSVVGIRELAAEKQANCYCLCNPKKFEDSDDLSLFKAQVVKGNPGSSVASKNSSSLFAFPAESNFSGAKYPLQWIIDVQRNSLSVNSPACFQGGDTKKNKWYVLCDAAAYVSTSFLDLNRFPADFVTISFYKIFGFPTGLGALLVKNGSESVLCNKKFFGGGSVSGWLSSHNFHSPKSTVHERFEDGSISFLSILGLKLGFDTFSSLGLDVHSVHEYTHKLWDKLYNSMKSCQHENGTNVVEIYLQNPDKCKTPCNQGPIIAFNIKRSDGSYVGFNDVLHLANSNDIYMRGGCFCNMGACSSLIGTELPVLLKAYEDGHVCGDAIDLIDGKPIGALRISLGPYTVESDIDNFLKFLTTCFRDSVFPSTNAVEDHLPPDLHQDFVLEKIILYPVKSCQGMSVTNWEICETGLKYDRMWMILDEFGAPITLKKNPHLIAIYPEVDPVRKILKLNASGMEEIEIPFLYHAVAGKINGIYPDQKCVSKVCGDTVDGFDCGESAAMWLSEVLCTKSTLLQKNFFSRRVMKGRLNVNGATNQLSLVNEAQFLLVNRTSVEYLYKKMVEFGDWDEGEVTEMVDNITKRFRSNFVISGPQAFSEDSWHKIAVTATDRHHKSNLVNFTKCGLCSRCNVVCVDPDSGRKLNGPLRALSNLLVNEDGVRRKSTFGIYLQCVEQSSFISVPSKVVIERDAVVN